MANSDIENTPRSSFNLMKDLICWDKDSKKVLWNNEQDMKTALVKINEFNKRSRRFYQIAWIEEDEMDEKLFDNDNDIVNGHVKEDGQVFDISKKIAVNSSLPPRNRWTIEHFSQFKNDKVKREQVRKLIKSKERTLPVEKLVMKQPGHCDRTVRREDLDSNNNNIEDDCKEVIQKKKR